MVIVQRIVKPYTELIVQRKKNVYGRKNKKSKKRGMGEKLTVHMEVT